MPYHKTPTVKKEKGKKTIFPMTRTERLIDTAETVQFTVYLDDKQTDKMKMYAPVFESGSIEDWLEWRKCFGRLVHQKKVTDPGKLFRLMQILIAGNALKELEQLMEDINARVEDENKRLKEAAKEGETPATVVVETAEHFAEAMQHLTLYFVPVKMAHMTRTFLRQIKKPRWMLVEDFKTRIKEINEYLDVMPDYRGENCSMTTYELQIIFEQAMPKNWRDSLNKTGRAEDMDFNEVVTYMKVLEDLDNETETSHRSQNTKTMNKSGRNQKGLGTHRGSGGGGGGSRNGNGNNGGSKPNNNNNRPSDNNNKGRGGGGSSQGSQSSRRSSHRARKPYCATCRTNEHGWHDCEHNPANQGRDANAIAEKKKKKKRVSIQDASSSDDSDHYLIEDAFIMDEMQCTECEMSSIESTESEWEETLAQVEMSIDEETHLQCQQTAEELKTYRPWTGDWEVNDSFFDNWSDDLYAIDMIETGDEISSVDGFQDFFMAEESNEISDDECPLVWNESDFQTVNTGDVTQQQLSEARQETMEERDCNSTTTPTIDGTGNVPTYKGLGPVGAYYEEGPFWKFPPAFMGGPHTSELCFDAFMNEPLHLGPTPYYYSEFPFYVNPIPERPLLSSGLWTHWVKLDPVKQRNDYFAQCLYIQARIEHKNLEIRYVESLNYNALCAWKRGQQAHEEWWSSVYEVNHVVREPDVAHYPSILICGGLVRRPPHMLQDLWRNRCEIQRYLPHFGTQTPSRVYRQVTYREDDSEGSDGGHDTDYDDKFDANDAYFQTSDDDSSDDPSDGDSDDDSDDGLAGEANFHTRQLPETQPEGETPSSTKGKLSCHIKVAVSQRLEDKGRQMKIFNALIDSGSAGSFIRRNALPKTARERPGDKHVWQTEVGRFETNTKATVLMQLPQFTTSRNIVETLQVIPERKNAKYDLIIGRDILSKIGLVVNFREATIEWDDLQLQMPKENEGLDAHSTVAVAWRKPTYEDDIDYESIPPTHLESDQREALLQLLLKYHDVFEGVLGKLPIDPVEVELKPDAKPYFGRPYPVPRAQRESFKAEVDRLVSIGVLVPCFDSPWGSPSFGIGKPDGSMRFVTDLRKVNERCVRKPYPIPLIEDIFHDVEGYDYATAVDFKMGFYHVPLSKRSQKIFTTVLPWGKYSYARLVMGYLSSPDIFQHTMQKIFGDIPGVIVYIDDLLILTKGKFQDHLRALDTVFERCRKMNIKVNVKKTDFCASEFPYLGFILAPTGIRPDPKKVEAIQRIEAPKTRKELQSFLGLVNYIRMSIPRHSKFTATMTELTSNKKTFRWTSEHQKAFEETKKQVMKATMLSYPRYDREFLVFTDASKQQVGSMIVQRDEKQELLPPIAYFSKKMSETQQRYSVMEKELLAIVLTLKKFRTLLWGQRIIIYTDHKNLTFESFTTDRVRRWRLYVEEFGPDIIYLPGVDNDAADALSRLKADFTSDDEEILDRVDIGVYDMNEEMTCPIDYNTIEREQETLPDEVKARHPKQRWGNTKLHSKDGRILIPQTLRLPLMEWYHNSLVHPGALRMLENLRGLFFWPRMKEQVLEFSENCDECQKFKLPRLNYAEVPVTEMGNEPWSELCLDCIGPYTLRTYYEKDPKTGNRRVKYKITLQCVSMIDPASRWLELARVKSIDAEEVAIKVDRTWFARYPRPLRCIHDNGNEFTKMEFQELLQSYGIQSVPTTVKNPQANSILERAHQVIGNMLRTYELDKRTDEELHSDEFLDGVVSNVAFAMRATFHTSLRASPAQVVYGRDMIFPTRYVADWQQIRQRRQQRREADNRRENSRRRAFTYRVGDEVLIRRGKKFGEILPKMNRPTLGPFTILEVFNNGNVAIQRKGFRERINVRRLLPYHRR